MKDENRQMPLISAKTALLTAVGIGAFAIVKSIYKEITKYDLRNKVVLITGGSRGLGLAIARELASKGAKIVICARSNRQLQNAKRDLESIGSDVLTVQADITKQAEVQNVIEHTISHFGRLDVLINNAGIISVGPQDTMDIKEYETVMETNFWAVLYTIKAAIPQFTKQGEGRIVNICSIGGKIAVPHLLPYSVSKFAMVGLSEGLGAELKKDNIHVTTVIPNLMRTGSPRNITVKGDHSAEYAWFKFGASSPLFSQKAENAARQIITALENGNNEVILTQTAKIAVAFQGLVPEAVNSVMQLANRFLPKNVSNGNETKKGYESESESSGGSVNALTDKAAIELNEI